MQAASARWIVGALALTLLAWLAALAGLLAVANRVHDDVPSLLAIKLPLLQSKPELIFGGESRTVYQVDAGLAAQLIGRPAGAAVNIAYDAGEPLALLAAMRREPDVSGMRKSWSASRRSCSMKVCGRRRCIRRTSQRGSACSSR